MLLPPHLPHTSGNEDYWIAVQHSSMGSGVVEVGLPAAVGRLLTTPSKRVLVDRLYSSIPKEKPACAVVVGLAVDALVRAWLQQIRQTGSCFEELLASATPFTAPILEKRGFVEIEKPDFGALGRGEPIATHQARLPAACVAYDYLLNSGSGLSLMDLSSYQNILDELRASPPPKSSQDSDSGVPLGTDVEDDPWSAMRNRAGF
ncbi:MAG: hypothetical protein SGPRY_006412 [Prymnesium sp.]